MFSLGLPASLEGRQKKKADKLHSTNRKTRFKERLALLPLFNAAVLSGHSYTEENFKLEVYLFIHFFLSDIYLFHCNTLCTL